MRRRQVHALTGQILHGCGNLLYEANLKFETRYFVNQTQQGGREGFVATKPPRSVAKKRPSSTTMQNLPVKAMNMESDGTKYIRVSDSGSRV